MAIDNNKKNKTRLPNKKRKSTSSKKKSNGFLTYLKRTFLVLLFLALTVMVIGAGYVFAILRSTPPLDVDAVTRLSAPSIVCDNTGATMDNVHSEIDRTIVTFDKIPQELKDAVTSIEDQRFYSHHGVDPVRIAGSIVTDITKILKGQSGMHGGSTLTQQLLKNTVLANESSAVERKIKEIWLALNLEKHLSKDEILSQYLNTIPVGGTSYGVQAAANLYFGEEVDKLNLIQCAYVAGVTQAPTYYSAYTEANKKDPSPYIIRTKSVLTKMHELGKITTDQYNKAIKDIDDGGLKFKSTKKSYNLKYEWYINPTISQVKADLIDKYKYTEEEASKLLANGGLKIMSNMDKTLQDYTQDLLDNYKATNVGLTETYIDGTNTPEFQASATIVDYKTGKVLALIGGRGDHSAQSTNRAYNYLRPIGSTTKPLTVYGPAINEKVLTAASTIDDSPNVDTIASKYTAGWQPRNDNKDILDGNVTIREGLRQSKNIVAVTVEDTLGMKTGISYGEKFGLIYNDASKSSMAAVALGQFNADNDGGNTFITSSAFGVFGNNGTYVEPKLYSKVYDASGNVILDTESEVKSTEIFSPQTAYIMYDMLKGSADCTGVGAQWGSMPVSGKTGTTTDKKDYWFTGVTPYLSGSVWLGYDTPKKMGGGSSNAAALWGKIMKKAHEGKAVTDIERPSGIVEREVCMDSGKLATSHCKSDHRSTGSRVYTEMFIEGTEPTTYCDAHVPVDVNKYTNKLASSSTPSFLRITKVFVKKAKPNSATADYPYLLPSEYDDGYGHDYGREEENDDNDDNDENNNSLGDIINGLINGQQQGGQQQGGQQQGGQQQGNQHQGNQQGGQQQGGQQQDDQQQGGQQQGGQ